MALDALTLNIDRQLTWKVEEQFAGQAAKTKQSGAAPGIRQRIITLVGVAPDNADTFLSSVLTIAPGGDTTIDLTNFEDWNGVAAQSMAFLRYAFVHLLSESESHAGVEGSAASSISVGNAAVDGHPLWMGADTHTTVIENGDEHDHNWKSLAGKSVDSATDGTGHNVKITNNDALVAAKVLVLIAGLAPGT